ncbi:MAG TPA: hypothetical protein VGK45_18490, partial [Thermoanaerobaculia bacterium]
MSVMQIGREAIVLLGNLGQELPQGLAEDLCRACLRDEVLSKSLHDQLLESGGLLRRIGIAGLRAMPTFTPEPAEQGSRSRFIKNAEVAGAVEPTLH